MLVHSVYFWLKDDLEASDIEAFEKGLRGLGAVESVRELHVGRPVGSSRNVVDSSYSFALIVIFDDKAGLDAYQPHPLHKNFVAEFSRCWQRIVVYDAA